MTPDLGGREHREALIIGCVMVGMVLAAWVMVFIT